MEQINLSTHGREIQRAYEQIVRGEGDATWVIYGPDSSKAYKIAETGSDFDEFLDSFNEAQIQFGWARVTPPGSDVQKNLLIGWCPDSAPLKPRSSFAQNFAEVTRLLKGYHVQITARDFDDLDKNELLSRLSSAAGARYSIQASRTNAPSSTTSSYRPTPVSRPIAPKPAPRPNVSKPVPAPRPVARPEPKAVKPAVKANDDWNEPEVEERDFSKNPLKPNASAWKPIGRVNLQEVIKEEKAKPDPRLEIEELKQKERLSRDQQIDDYLKAKPAAFGSKAPAPETSFGTNSDKLVGGISKSFGAEGGKTPAQLWAEKRHSGSAPSKAVESQESQVTEVEANPQEDVSNLKSKFDQLQVQAKKEEEETVVKPKARTFQPPPPPVVRTVPLSASAQEEPTPTLPSRTSVPASAPAPVQMPVSEPRSESVPALPSRTVPQEQEPTPTLPYRAPVSEPEPEHEQEQEQEQGEEDEGQYATAIAEYDYVASEDNELTFSENQRIINIQFVDEDWWLGELENGETGLFPSNYVTLE